MSEQKKVISTVGDGVKVKISVDTSELDEAIKKAKMLNQLLTEAEEKQIRLKMNAS